MSQFRRDYFELKRAEAMDMTDPRSFAVHRPGSIFNRPAYRPRKVFCTLHSNRNCSECKKKKTLVQKRRRQRTLDMNVLVSDFHGFRWVDTKADEYQSLTISGKRMETGANSWHNEPHDRVRFQSNGSFFSELSSNRPILVTKQEELYHKPTTMRKYGFESFEDKERSLVLNVKQDVKIGTSNVVKEMESSRKDKRRINVVLPRIT